MDAIKEPAATHSPQADTPVYVCAQPAADAAPYNEKRIYEHIKRAFDIGVSFLALIVLSPVFLLIAAAVKLDSKGPAIYAQQRIGKNGAPFTLYKFRSMVTDAQQRMAEFTPQQRQEFENNFKLDDDFRLTRIGRFIRRTSLDELPQFYNILTGSLSLVGPRPIVQKELEKYGGKQALFLSVKPGLTGYWQVNGRSAVTYAQRIELELYYVRHRSFWLDFKILLKTFAVVFTRKGAK